MTSSFFIVLLTSLLVSVTSFAQTKERFNAFRKERDAKNSAEASAHERVIFETHLEVYTSALDAYELKQREKAFDYLSNKSIDSIEARDATLKLLKSDNPLQICLALVMMTNFDSEFVNAETKALFASRFRDLLAIGDFHAHLLHPNKKTLNAYISQTAFSSLYRTIEYASEELAVGVKKSGIVDLQDRNLWTAITHFPPNHESAARYTFGS